MLRPLLAVGLILTMLVTACAAPTPTPTALPPLKPTRTPTPTPPTATPTPTLTPTYTHAYAQAYQSATKEGLTTHSQRHAYAEAYAEAVESGAGDTVAAATARSYAATVPKSRVYPTPTPFPTLSPAQRRSGPTYLQGATRRAPSRVVTPSICGPGMWRWTKSALDPIWMAIPSQSLYYSTPRLQGWSLTVEFFQPPGVYPGVYEATVSTKYVGEYRTLAAAQCAAAQAALRFSR